MTIRTVLFDLDGTLLPMDLDEFVESYLKLLAKKMAPLGYDGEKLIRNIWTGTAAMAKNDGSRTNEAAFWQAYSAVAGPVSDREQALFEEFYAVEFQQAKAFCGFEPKAAQTVRMARDLGMRVALAPPKR